MLLLYMVGSRPGVGYRHILDAFWDEGRLAGIPLPTERPVSAPSFCAARAKVSPEFIRTLLHSVSDCFDSRFRATSRWKSRRVLGVDGSGVNLQRSDELRQAFGCLDSAHCPQIQLSTLLNLVSKVPANVAIGRYKTSEQAMLIEEHVPLLKRGDIVVVDRGYQGFPVIESLVSAGADFVVRVPASGTFRQVDDFVRSGGRDRRVKIPPSRRAKTKQTLSLRVLRCKRPDGKDMILLTSLHKAKGFSHADIEQLYRMRWESEEHFKAVKSPYMGQGQLHSRTAAGVRQEMLAIGLYHALSQYFLAASAEVTGNRYSDLSTKSACLGLSDYIVRLFVNRDPRAADWLQQFLERIARTRDQKRPGRSYPRRSFKPRNRWGPRGRNRA